MAKKKKSEYFDLDQVKDEVVEIVIEQKEDSNRALKLQIIHQIENINNHYYLMIIKKYIDQLGG